MNSPTDPSTPRPASVASVALVALCAILWTLAGFAPAAADAPCALLETIDSIEWSNADTRCEYTASGQTLGVLDDASVLRDLFIAAAYGVGPGEVPSGRRATLTCAVLEQSRQLCGQGGTPGSYQLTDSCPDANCEQVITRSCHKNLEVRCDQQQPLDLASIFANAGIVGGDTATTPGDRTYCTDQVIGDVGYPTEIPADPIEWICTTEEIATYRAIFDQLVASGQPPLGYQVWSIGNANNVQREICRFGKAVAECVLPNLDPGYTAGDEVMNVERCAIERQDGGTPYTDAECAGTTNLAHCGSRYPAFGDYCFRIVELNGSGPSHGSGRAADFNNRIGEWNSGTLGSSANLRPAQLTLPPEFVALMEGCGFEWLGRIDDAKIGNEDPALLESCDPMHFELPEVTAPPSLGTADTVLVLDSSGSMGTNDPNGQRKVAARLFLNVVPDGDKVAALDFDGSVRQYNTDVLSPGDDAERAQILAVIDSVDSSGLTNIGAALDTSCDILRRPSAQNPFKAAILLTDGQDSVTGAEKDCFIDNDWSLHVLGFGGAVQSQLDAIIANTGPRSTADLVGSAEEVLCRMLQLRTELTGESSDPCLQYSIDQGQTITFSHQLGDVGRVTFTIAWPGSDVQMTLISPSGRVIDRGVDAPDVIHEVGPTFESYTIDCPEAGAWTVELYGADIPAGVEPVVYGTSEIEGGSCGPTVVCGTEALGVAGAFNAFALDDFVSHGSETQGRAAAGDLVDLSSYSVGRSLPSGSGDVLVAGGHLRYRDGNIRHGDAVYGGSADLDDSAVIPHGVLRQGTPIDFAAAEIQLEALASALGAQPATSITDVGAWGKITLTGSEPDGNVFHVDAADLADAHTVVVDVPVDATAIVVLGGATVTIADAGVTLKNGATRAGLLWVAPDALDVRIDTIGLEGSVLAPHALVEVVNAHVDGTVIGDAIHGDGFLKHFPFAGCLAQP